ncbi:hypothetical protein QTP88_006929, partial [Uroleucon formosanum]
MEILLKIFFTLPIGSARAERAMSVLRRLKNYLCSIIVQNRISNLALLSMEYEAAQDLNMTELINKFSKAKVRREGPALTFYDNNESNLTNDIKWADLENKLESEFKPTAQLDMLKLLLQKRKQLEDEQTINYVNEIESL